jgi:tryptophanyl-tRNA synthetase
LKERYRRGQVGDVEVKEKLIVALNRFLDPIRERRALVEADRGLSEQILYEGTVRTQMIAEETAMIMKRAMGLTGVWNKVSRKGRERMKKHEPGEPVIAP